MWYKNITVGSLDQSQSKRVTDRWTDRITTPKTALAQLRRTVKMDNQLLNTIIGSRKPVILIS